MINPESRMRDEEEEEEEEENNGDLIKKNAR